MTSRIRPILAAAFGAVALTSLAAAAQTGGSRERFTALAVNMQRGTSSAVDIVIDRWSSDAERDRLLTVLMDQGADKLLDALQHAPKVGYIRRPGRLAYDLHYARRAPLPDGGARIVIATDRPMGFWEVANQTRSVSYPFTVIEMHVDANGEGEGKISVATKIIPDKENKLIVLENYDTQPVLLKGVKLERTTSGRN